MCFAEPTLNLLTIPLGLSSLLLWEGRRDWEGTKDTLKWPGEWWPLKLDMTEQSFQMAHWMEQPGQSPYEERLGAKRNSEIYGLSAASFPLNWEVGRLNGICG